jgi:class 3 adenylate cyclase/CheY-like chemotaxis protein
MTLDPSGLAHLRHELRTPLNHVLGYSEMLLEDAPESGDLVPALQRVRAEGRAVLAVVEDSLAAVRIEATGVDLDRFGVALAGPLDRLGDAVDRLGRVAATTPGGAAADDAERISGAVARLRMLVESWVTGSSAGAPVAPVAPTTTVAEEDDRRAAAAAGSAPSTILVVDDNEENRQLLARRLARQGHRVLTAAGGREALALLQGEPVDLVLLDVMMPDLDGPAVLARLKQDPERRHIPVLMISALDETASVVRSIELGAEDYLPKPYDPVLLRARIGACLEKKRLRDQEDQHALALAEWNRTLERRVAEQVSQVERLGRLKRFFSPQLAELIVAGGTEDPLRTHRREITVVFLDLRGFTGFAETAEPEEVMGVLREYHEAMGRLILEHEGTLERFTGDGMMVFFNDPVPVENPAERAVRMAVAMRERVRELRAGWRKRGHDLDLGVGIAQGYATIGAIGFEGRWDYGAIGTVTNLAARLCAEAQGGQVLITSRVAAATEELIQAEEVGALSLRGLTRPVPTLNVVGLTQA